MALTKVTGQVINTNTDVTVGVLTVTNNLSVGGTLTYEDVTNIDSVGLITARDGISITGGNVTLTGGGSFTGDGSNLTGISGFATALSSSAGFLNQIFKTPETASVGSATSISIESDATSGNVAFTKCQIIHVSTGSTLHVGSATTFVTNVLNVF